MGHIEAVCWMSQPHLAPKWFMDKLGCGEALSKPLPHANGSKRSRSTSEMAIRRDFNAKKRGHGKGCQEHYAKSVHMTTAAPNNNLDNQVNHACAISVLQDEVDCRVQATSMPGMRRWTMP